MASFWSQERAGNVISDWAAIRNAKLLDFIAEAIEAAEAYGYQRGFETGKELGVNNAHTT